MARGEVARLCRVGEGRTSSGRNSGSFAKRSSKYTSDRTLQHMTNHKILTTLYMQWGHIHFFHLNLYINRNAIKSLKCLWFCTNRNHISTNNAIFHETYLSTESNGRLSGGGRALTFLGGASLSPWDWGGAGSDPEGGGNGEGGRDSFHSAWVEQKN